MNTYRLLLKSSFWRRYADIFPKATGMALRLLPTSGQAAKRFPQHKSNPFCARLATDPAVQKGCLRNHEDLLRRLDRKLSCQQLKCPAGMVRAGVPVVVGGRHVATLVTSAVLAHKPSAESFQRLRKLLKQARVVLDWKRAKRLYSQVAVVPAGRCRATVDLLHLCALHLAEYGSKNMLAIGKADPVAVRHAKRFAREHPDPHASADAARHVGLAPAYFCRLFKQSTRMTYTEYLGRLRIERAKTLLADPDQRIAQVALAAGFQSTSQFNRTFRRLVGVTPTAYRCRRLL